MLKRKFYFKLIEWKNSKKNECLLVNGPRQVGKTFIIDQFGKENYKSYIYLNLFKDPEQREIFEGSLDPQEIFKRLSIHIKNAKIIPNSTLIFIDEIQICKKARTALKFLALDNSIDVIASGSLLGITYNKLENQNELQSEFSIPVGYERKLEMFSLDFEEFLWATGTTQEAINLLKEYFDKKEKIPFNINELFLSKLREFLVVGGMPEVVNTFLQTNNFSEVNRTQQKIFKAYEDDIMMYAKNSDKPKIKACYFSIPRQLAKEYTKFQYKTIEKSASAKKYESSLEWLENAGLIKRIFNVSYPQMPLKAYEKTESFKIYVSDIGLLTNMFGFETQKALLKKELTGFAKGGIYENLIFDIFYKKEYNLFYYKKDTNSQEIEFLIEKNSNTIPIEVKSKNGSTQSLNNFIQEFSPRVAYKVIDGNLGFEPPKFIIPQYMATFI